MNAEPVAPASADWKLPSPKHIGIAFLILAETSLFTIFVVAYLFYIGKSLNPPYPADVLDLPILATICLLSSSLTIMVAEGALKRGRLGLYRGWWLVTILLGAAFLGFTAVEWYDLIVKHGLTISTNVFGTTFYSLVGLHATHVIVGLFLLSVIFIASMVGKVEPRHHDHIAVISWYWHFVDVIWIVVFSVVYVIGR